MAVYGHGRRQSRGFWLIGLALLVSVLLLSAQGWATTLYVSDTTVEVNLRTGTNPENRIIALLRPGTQVTVLAEEDGWTQVALDDGRSGWILKRYLSARQPWRFTAEKRASENKQLQARLSLIERNHRELSQENSKLQKELKAVEQEVQSVHKAHEDLKKEAADYLNLKAAYEALQSETKQNRDRLEKVQRSYEELKLSTSIRWFLTGAGVLIFGWLVGLSMGRMRRRRATDLYRL